VDAREVRDVLAHDRAGELLVKGAEDGGREQQFGRRRLG
jgi:hypothetical protein